MPTILTEKKRKVLKLFFVEKFKQFDRWIAE